MSIMLETDLYTIAEITNSGINHFEIKSYQRGYRWDIEDVKTLIRDIIESDDNKIYCMQPLVVTQIKDNSYEVIDGQQRLTTFKILLHCLNLYFMNSDIKDYGIYYETRSCESFLNKLYKGEINTEIKELNLEAVTAVWNVLSLEKNEINRDNFHLFQSYCTCRYILKELELVIIESILQKIKTQVKFIWYEVNLNLLNTSAEKLFGNINKNKIRLTGADLIKALFILDIDNQNDYNIEVKHHTKQLLAHEWDEIEQTLRNPDFWFFITNSKEQHYDVRIGKLFDIITFNKQESDLGAYFIMKEQPLLRDWNLLYKSFKIALEWFEDNYLYHRIGFLVNMAILSFDAVLEEYNKKTTTSKKVFKEWLETKIEDYIATFDIDKINYEKNKGRYGKCTAVLLLYNILLLEKYYPHQKFSFGDFVEQEWSLEHIQPQNPKVKKVSNWLVWLNEIEIVIKEKFEIDTKIIKVDFDQYKIEEINFDFLVDHLSKMGDKDKMPNEIVLQLNIIQDLFEEEYATHKLSNLALLDKVTNSKLSNGSFKEKRSLILKINESTSDDEETVFLPLGTINVFSKSMIFDTAKIQLEYWSATDGEFYFDEIKKLLKPYLNAN